MTLAHGCVCILKSSYILTLFLFLPSPPLQQSGATAQLPAVLCSKATRQLPGDSGLSCVLTHTWGYWQSQRRALLHRPCVLGERIGCTVTCPSCQGVMVFSSLCADKRCPFLFTHACWCGPVHSSLPPGVVLVSWIWLHVFAAVMSLSACRPDWLWGVSVAANANPVSLSSVFLSALPLSWVAQDGHSLSSIPST